MRPDSAGAGAGQDDANVGMMQNNVEEFAQQFNMPAMDPEAAAQYAQYYQELYRQSEEYARDLQNTQGGTNGSSSEPGNASNSYM